MDTPSSSNVSVISKGVERKLQLITDNDIRKINIELIPEIKEYDPVCIQFHSLQGSRLYLEGIDMFPKEEETLKDIFSLDRENIPYFSPQEKPFYIYRLDTKDYIDPLIPGFYELRIVEADQTFYSWIKVIPKNMGTADWELMKNEIENTVSGLAMEVLQRKNGFQDLQYDRSNDATLFKKMEVLVKESDRINYVIETIINNPKSEIENNYEWVEKSKKSELNIKSVQTMMRRPHKISEVYALQRTLSYDIPINQELKIIASFLFSETKKLKKFLEQYTQEILKIYSNDRYKNIHDSKRKNTLASLEKQRKILIRLMYNLDRLLTEEWMEKVTNKLIRNSVNLRISDSKYLYIKKVYLLIRKQGEEVSLGSKYQYYWKQSAQLYEIWGFIKMMQVLTYIGFTPVDGWLYDNYKFKVPFLNDGDFVLYKRGDLHAQLVFNEEISRESKKTSVERPLYTNRTNNKPDFRIDFFKNERFLGSIVCDTKYRSLYNIWFQKNSRVKVREQIRNYREIQSPFFLKDKSEALRAHTKPVSVLVIFPILTEMSKKEKIEREDNISFQELNPRTDISILADLVNEKIKALEEIDFSFY